MFMSFCLILYNSFYWIVALVYVCCNFGNSYELLVWYT